ncbi:MAG: LytTR family transcriptional regulator DNA-binding domain-containing protein [Bacteroidota bacterium]
MKVLRILVLADDREEAEQLTRLLTQMGYETAVHISGSSDGLLPFLQKIPDLVILDVDQDAIANWVRGIPSARLQESVRFPMIFISSFQSVDPQKLNAPPAVAHFLAKPYSKKQLRNSLERVVYAYSWGNDTTGNSPGLDLRKGSLPKHYFFLKQQDRYLRQNIADIYWIKADNNRIIIHSGKEEIRYGVSLKKFCLQIVHPDLLRIHKSYLVNIQRIFAFEEGLAYLSDGTPFGKRIPIGDRYKKAFLDRFTRLRT